MNVHVEPPFVTQRWDGEQITKPGVYEGVPIERYHEDTELLDGPSVSSSGLRTIWGQGAAAYWIHSPLNESRLPREDKEHFNLGSAAHTLLLGEDGFWERYAIRPVKWKDWRKAEAKEWREARKAEGYIVITAENLEQIRGMAGLQDWQQDESCRVPESGLANCRLVQSGLLNGLVERTIIYRDPETGIWIRNRPDNLPVSDGMIVDLKTIATQDPNKAIFEHGLHMQGALAGDCLKGATGVEMNSFVLLFVQKVAPFAVRVIELNPYQDSFTGELVDPIAIGREQNRQAIKKFAKCWGERSWPANDGGTPEARMPPWYLNKVNRAEQLAAADEQGEGDSDGE